MGFRWEVAVRDLRIGEGDKYVGQWVRFERHPQSNRDLRLYSSDLQNSHMSRLGMAGMRRTKNKSLSVFIEIA